MILHRTRGPEDWKAHLAQPERHWKPFRSAMETALSWEAQEAAPPEIAALFPTARLVQAVVEYPVALPGGDRDSFNDVFALFADADGLIVCMIEAKRDEPFGPTLGEWRTDGAGRRSRLGFLAETLGLEAATLPDVLRYQLLHRAASAVLTARTYRTNRAAMVVQSFSPEHRWFVDFEAFSSLMGASDPGVGRLSTVRPCGDVSFALGWAHAPFRTPQAQEAVD